jgi:hypothetical protein
MKEENQRYGTEGGEKKGQAREPALLIGGL